MMKANANQQTTFFALLGALLTLFFGGNAAAAGLLADSPAEGDHADHQRVLIAPYGWAMAVSETVGINGIVVPLDLQNTEFLPRANSSDRVATAEHAWVR